LGAGLLEQVLKYMNKLPHSKNHKYDLHTGLCDYCGKMKPKKVRKAKSKEPRCKMTTSGRHIWQEDTRSDSLTGITVWTGYHYCLACRIYKY
jgi:hypothetical protein